MRKFLLTTALILCLPAMAAEKKAQPTTEMPADAIPNPVKPGKGGPAISVEESSKMSPAEAQKHANAPNPIAGPLKAPPPLVPQEFKPVEAQPPVPLPHGPPVGRVAAIMGSIPQGWTDCEKTHAAEQCKAVAESQGIKDEKMIIKLPEDGSIEELNEFLDAMAAIKAEAKP
jgi:hypothetical protein